MKSQLPVTLLLDFTALSYQLLTSNRSPIYSDIAYRLKIILPNILYDVKHEHVGIV